MERFNMYLPKPLLEKLRQQAEEAGISVSEVIRGILQKSIE